MHTLSPNTLIDANDLNDNFTDLSTGAGDTTNNSLTTFRNEVFYDFVVTGCLWSGDSYGANRNASMTSGVLYIDGVRIVVASITARTFTASKDTYIDVDSTGTVTYSEVANGASSPALASGSIRIAIIVTAAGSIAAAASINQGDLYATNPVISSTTIKGCDSNGVPIYNTNPVELCFKRVGVSSPAPTVEADVVGTAMTFTLAKAAKVYIDISCHFQLNSGATRTAYWKLYIDGSAMDQVWAQDNPGASETHLDGYKGFDTMLAAGAHTIKIRSVANTGSTVAIDGGIRVRIR